MSIFATQDAAFAGFLQRISGLRSDDATNSAALIARNFLLEDGLGPTRFETYRATGAVNGHVDYGEWKRAHEAYLKRHIQLAVDQRPPHTVNPADEHECPETFRSIDPDSPFQYSDDNLDLVRLVELDFVASRAGESPSDVKNLAMSVVASSDPRLVERQALSDVLDEWLLSSDHRPVYGAFWEDVFDLFGDTQAGDSPDWANSLRDRLGLAHIQPRTGVRALDVLVFRYPIRSVPRLQNAAADQRPLVPPTVLDGNHSPAFCPSPVGQQTGRSVDLSQQKPICREILHPALDFRVEHLWRVGQVTKTVDMQQLIDGRRWHLAFLRELPECADFAASTDADLFS